MKQKGAAFLARAEACKVAEVAFDPCVLIRIILIYLFVLDMIFVYQLQKREGGTLLHLDIH